MVHVKNEGRCFERSKYSAEMVKVGARLVGRPSKEIRGDIPTR